MTKREQEVALIEEFVKAGLVKKCSYQGDTVSLAPYKKKEKPREPEPMMPPIVPVVV